MILIDVFVHENKIVTWYKQEEENIFQEHTYNPSVYIKATPQTEKIVQKYSIEKKTCTLLDGTRDVFYKIQVPKIYAFKPFVKRLEYEIKHQEEIYYGDISPEYKFLYEKQLEILNYQHKEQRRQIIDYRHIAFTKLFLEIHIHEQNISSITVNKKTVTGTEQEILILFSKKFVQVDPDIIFLENAYATISFLAKKLREYGIPDILNRFTHELNYKGGKTFFSYGRAVYKDFSVKLKGRILINTTTTIGSLDFIGILELCKLSNGLVQDIVSKSYGSIFSTAVNKEIALEKKLIPYKEKPLEEPLSLINFTKGDRTAHVFDPILGTTKNVLEIDFSSMFPWIIYNYNLSAETIKKGKTYQKIPELPIYCDLSKKGITPKAIKPFLSRRMEAKTNKETEITKALKGVLVSSYGYLRFREFKLGTPASYMAICSVARNILIQAKEIAEQHGFSLVHGIVDSLYLQKNNYTTKEVEKLVHAIYTQFGIPVEYELFDSITFLPSVTNNKKPVATKYYAKYKQQEKYKLRGLMCRKKSTPPIIKTFQKKIILLCEQKNYFTKCTTLLRKYVSNMKNSEKKEFIMYQTIGKEHYKTYTIGKTLIKKCKEKNICIHPGQTIAYYYGGKKICLAEEENNIQYQKYTDMLIDAVHEVINIYGHTKQEIRNALQYNTLTQYFS